jgi:hypothetical protein
MAVQPQVEAYQSENVVRWRYRSKALLLGNGTELGGNGRGGAVRVAVGRDELGGSVEHRKAYFNDYLVRRRRELWVFGHHKMTQGLIARSTLMMSGFGEACRVGEKKKEKKNENENENESR